MKEKEHSTTSKYFHSRDDATHTDSQKNFYSANSVSIHPVLPVTFIGSGYNSTGNLQPSAKKILINKASPTHKATDIRTQTYTPLQLKSKSSDISSGKLKTIAFNFNTFL